MERFARKFFGDNFLDKLGPLMPITLFDCFFDLVSECTSKEPGGNVQIGTFLRLIFQNQSSHIDTLRRMKQSGIFASEKISFLISVINVCTQSPDSLEKAMQPRNPAVEQVLAVFPDMDTSQVLLLLEHYKQDINKLITAICENSYPKNLFLPQVTVPAVVSKNKVDYVAKKMEKALFISAEDKKVISRATLLNLKEYDDEYDDAFDEYEVNVGDDRIQDASQLSKGLYFGDAILPNTNHLIDAPVLTARKMPVIVEKKIEAEKSVEETNADKNPVNKKKKKGNYNRSGGIKPGRVGNSNKTF